MKSEATPKTTYLKDYRPPEFWIREADLSFDLEDKLVRVTSKLQLEKSDSTSSVPLHLDGEKLTLERVRLNGELLQATSYQVEEAGLLIRDFNGAVLPSSFQLETLCTFEPHTNLSCEGLYFSEGMFVTQCEAESFRRITYYVDRPDVMAIFKVTIRADQKKYPILLSNGNPISRQTLADGRHEVTWYDPFKKPCYLFALVAGDMGVIEDSYVTKSGRTVKLQIFAKHGVQDRCWFAMDSLKKTMTWDEVRFGLEYDLDIFMIVAADNFNMGAMENKGLNIFNSRFILAKPETATDKDFLSTMAVVGHEYFHNWTGNRVTCRDWFQLSLKEGLTVFRDQEFTADMAASAVNRIEEVNTLRTIQFAEDAGPMAHPIRPQSYITIDNFYTITVYEKGAEVIRMIQTILGRDGFRRGIDKYFELFDGQAVTTEDFIRAMEIAGGLELTHFKNWYDQAGTPNVRVTEHYDVGKGRLELTLEQSCLPTPQQPEKKPFHIPIALGLIGPEGRELEFELSTDSPAPQWAARRSSKTESYSGAPKQNTLVLHLTKPKQTFAFEGLKVKPATSFLRGFSAPVRVNYQRPRSELAFLMAHDIDEVARWEASQQLTIETAMQLFARGTNLTEKDIPRDWVDAFAPIIADRSLPSDFKAYLLDIPSELYLAQFTSPVDPDVVFVARENLLKALAHAYEKEFEKIHTELSAPGVADGMTVEAAGKRALRNRALEYLVVNESTAHLNRALEQMKSAKTLTEEFGALVALNRSMSPVFDQAVQTFRKKWEHEALVINKWMAAQAISQRPDTLSRVIALGADPVFDKTNPNKIYALLVGFAKQNPLRFHDLSGKAYSYITDQVLDIDSRNPQVAARLVSCFTAWRTLEPRRQTLIRRELERIVSHQGLSKNVFEITSRSLSEAKA